MRVPQENVRKSLRDFCEITVVCTPIPDELELKKVPHRTTLHKFSKRADARRLWSTSPSGSCRRRIRGALSSR